jgi:hypothetical protein
MRRTHSSLKKDNSADPKVVADQPGHSLDVNLNVYTQTALSLRKQAVNVLESTLEQTGNPLEVSRVV